MAALLYIVARDRMDLYARFTGELTGAGGSRVILDRRASERRHDDRRQEGGRGLPGRRVGRERRRRRELEAQLSAAGFFTVPLARESG